MVQPDTQLSIESVRDWLAQVFLHGRNLTTLTPLAADASTRRYVRARWDGRLKVQPASCVIMRCDPWSDYDMPAFMAVAYHLQRHGVRVPHIYAAVPSEGLMCLEDFGDRTLADAWHMSAPAARLIWGQRAVDAVVDMHVKATRHQDAACPAFGLSFDVPKLQSELQFFRQHAVEGLWQHVLPDSEREAFEAGFMPLCTMLADQPQYFCHRDYHGWNIMACCDDTVGILDFQDARMGPQPYDVVSLLVDRGTPETLGYEACAALVNYYLERFRAETGERVDREGFAVLFDLVAVQRCLKAIGTFAFMTVVNHRPHYQAYIAPTLTYIEPLMRRYGMLRPLMDLLQRYATWREIFG
jgi:aminoglycoside/choline kinase family phosphotransferase